MKTRIRRIGTARVIFIPKSLLEAVGIRDEVELTAHPGQIVIHAAAQPRAGWDEAFRAMAERGDDALLDP